MTNPGHPDRVTERRMGDRKQPQRQQATGIVAHSCGQSKQSATAIDPRRSAQSLGKAAESTLAASESVAYACGGAIAMQ